MFQIFNILLSDVPVVFIVDVILVADVTCVTDVANDRIVKDLVVLYADDVWTQRRCPS